MAWYQEWFGEEYLELYAHRDEDEAKRQVAFFQREIGSVDGPVLDLACGMGRHVTELQASGYRAVGCDLSFTLLRTGIREYGPMPVARADMRHLPFCDRRLRRAGQLLHELRILPDRRREHAGRARDGARTASRGRRFCSTISTFIASSISSCSASTTADGHVQIERWFDSSDRSFNKRITIGEKRYLERVRGYDLDEISAMFAACNLSIRSAFGNFDGTKFDHASPRLILMGNRER